MCEVFAKTLSLDTVFPTDSFFDLGGSSLSLTRLVIAAEKAEFNFAYADVFSHPTPESLALLETSAIRFLGIHVLHELLHSHSGKVFCILHGKETQSAKQRLNGLFFYYFDEIPSEIYKDRLETIEGDITNPESFEKIPRLALLVRNDTAFTVINCAANVKHFSKGNDIFLDILDFCKRMLCSICTTTIRR